MRRNPPYRLGGLPADLRTGHGAVIMPQLPVQAATARARAALQNRTGTSPDAGTVRGARLLPWTFKTIAGSRQFINARDPRYYLLIQNNSAADLWVNFDADAAVGLGIKIVSGGSAEWYYFCPYNALYFWAAAAGGAFVVLEA